jgi:hypothetical protein
MEILRISLLLRHEQCPAPAVALLIVGMAFLTYTFENILKVRRLFVRKKDVEMSRPGIGYRRRDISL